MAGGGCAVVLRAPVPERRAKPMVLPRFMVPDETQVVVPEAVMREAVEAMFVAIGMPADAAAECTDVLVASDLRGNDSHGVSNMLREYIGGFLRGRPDRGYRVGGPIYDCNPRPQFRTVRERPGTAVIDADGALGIHVGPLAMRTAIAKAKAVGSGSVVVRNAGHFGAIGYFAKMAAEAGCVGQVMLSSGGNMPPTFGGAPRLGTNPFAWAAPAGAETPLMLDMATTQARSALGLQRSASPPAQLRVYAGAVVSLLACLPRVKRLCDRRAAVSRLQGTSWASPHGWASHCPQTGSPNRTAQSSPPKWTRRTFDRQCSCRSEARVRTARTKATAWRLSTSL
jgi:hypothetical protein